MKLIRNNRVVGIFQHYFLILTCLVLSCLLISSLSLMVFVASTWSADLQQTMLDGSYLLKDEIVNCDLNHVQNEKRNAILQSILTLHRTTDADYFIVDNNGAILYCKEMLAVDANGQTFASNCSTHSHVKFSSETLSLIDASSSDYLQKGAIDIDRNHDYILTGIRVSDSSNAYYIISVQLLRNGYQPYITQYMKMTVAASFIAVVMAFFSSLAVTYRIVRPLRKMVEATKHYSIGEFSYRIRNVGRYEEFNELATAFNRMAKNLEENEKTRKNFVANVSHELKTPMTTIGGFIDGILDGTIPEEETEHYLKIVSEVVKHLSGLVISMLNVSKIEAGKVELEYSEFPLDQLVIQLIVGFEKTITEKDIDVVGLDKLDSVCVRADEALIRQVVYNLIDNAVKFTDRSGIIKIELIGEKKNVKLVVSNSGSCIPQDELNSIFERFYKVDKSRGLDSSSFGLGLHIVRSIVEMHGGSISAESKDDTTKFTVRLPLFNND